MIDTIKLFLDTNEKTLAKYIGSISKVVKLNGSSGKYRGKLKNLRITIRAYGIFIEGSLAKYALGQNLKNIYIHCVRKTLQSLEKILG